MDIIVNFSVREDKDHKARTCETIIVRDVVVKDIIEVEEEISDQLFNAVEMCYEELGLSTEVDGDEEE